MSAIIDKLKKWWDTLGTMAVMASFILLPQVALFFQQSIVHRAMDGAAEAYQTMRVMQSNMDILLANQKILSDDITQENRNTERTLAYLQQLESNCITLRVVGATVEMMPLPIVTNVIPASNVFGFHGNKRL